ncbi:hypothetical protein [Megasphaera sp.]|jgi:hypothetical protein|uniref:hypothetical protein n=1 Tax=Megasphaera sp. TaxID=2023260 RepID=UPI003A5C3C2B
MGAIKKLLILFIVVGCFAFTGCGNEPKQPPKDEVTQRIEAEFESFNKVYHKYSGVDSFEVKDLYESNRNPDYAKVQDLIHKTIQTADKNIQELNNLKANTPKEMLDLPNVGTKLDYSIEIAEEQKKLAEAVRNRDTAAFDEAYNNILNLETSIKKFEHYDDRYLKDAIADAKGKPR